MHNLLVKVTLSTGTVLLVSALVLSACQPGAASTPTPIPTPTPAPTPTLAFTAPAPTLAPATATPTTPPRTAALSELQDEVSARTIASAAWESATDGQTIQAGGGARTGEEARARLDISDGTIIRVAADSEFELNELSGQGDEAVTKLALTVGKVWAGVTEALGLGEFEIETPSGSATVRGSYMSLEYFDATGQVVVTCLEGQCQLTGASGKATDLTNGQQTEIPGAGKDPSPAKPMDPAQYADWAQNFPGAPVPTPMPSPTDTPTVARPPTITPTTTKTPTNTPIPVPTFTPASVSTVVGLALEGCTRTSAPAGLIIFGFGAGGGFGLDRETAIAAIGDGAATITVNGQPTSPLSEFPEGVPLDSRGRTIELQYYQDQWNYLTYTQIVLGPGEYNVYGEWVRNDQTERRGCTLTVTGP